MKQFCLLWVLVLGFAGVIKAQQTYFNVPSSDVVDKGKLSVQQQINISESLRSSTTVEYGLGHEWEIGVNVYNLDYLPADRRVVANDSTTEKAYSPLLLINTQKAFDITKNIELGVGAQAGMNVLTSRRPQFVGYAYGNIAFASDDEHYNISLGGYLANARYLGDGTKTGFQTGFDAGIFYQKVHLIADWISGSHDFGQLVAGVELYLGKKLPLAIGWQRINKTGDQAVVLQLTFNPK